MEDVNQFKNEFEPYLRGYDVEHRFFEEGDFGSLNQIEFNSQKKGGEVEFWSRGVLYVHFVNYENGDELINILLMPEQDGEKEIIFQRLKELL